jgi:predicted DCC family thiol-disulfide oxidoreductase YuxK
VNVADKTSDTAPRGWILYDDSCGICRRWVPFWRGTLQKRGFEIAPLQSDWVRERLALPDAVLLNDLRLLLPDGRQIQGADAYRHVLRRIWWAYPIYLVSVAPICRRMFDWGYRKFAQNRHRISSSCGLPGERTA